MMRSLGALERRFGPAERELRRDTVRFWLGDDYVLRLRKMHGGKLLVVLEDDWDEAVVVMEYELIRDHPPTVVRVVNGWIRAHGIGPKGR